MVSMAKLMTIGTVSLCVLSILAFGASEKPKQRDQVTAGCWGCCWATRPGSASATSAHTPEAADILSKAKVTVTKTGDGVVVVITSDDADVVKQVQAFWSAHGSGAHGKKALSASGKEQGRASPKQAGRHCGCGWCVPTPAGNK